MSEHKHGTMDVTSQKQTFEGFVRWVVGGSVACIAVLIFLAIFNS